MTTKETREELTRKLAELEANKPPYASIGDHYDYCRWEADCCEIKLKLAQLDGDYSAIRRAERDLARARYTGD